LEKERRGECEERTREMKRKKPKGKKSEKRVKKTR
jgi:hypothetical protein